MRNLLIAVVLLGAGCGTSPAKVGNCTSSGLVQQTDGGDWRQVRFCLWTNGAVTWELGDPSRGYHQ